MKQEPDYHTDMSVGEILRRAREHYGQTLEQVERNLRIRVSQIDAIEQGDLSRLPGRVYAIGFVRSYSEYLGFDGDKMVLLFKKQSYASKPESNLNFPEPASESKLPATPFAIVAAIIGFVVIGFWASSYTSGAIDYSAIPPVSQPEIPDVAALNMAKAPVAPVPEAAPVAEPAVPKPEDTNVVSPDEKAPPTVSLPGGITVTADEKNISAEPVSVQIAPPAVPPAEDQPATPDVSSSQQKGILINVVENSWVEIRDSNGKAIVSRVLKAGDEYFVPDSPDLTMSLGNASGVRVVVDGVELGPLGSKGEVKRGIPLNTKKLKALAKSDR